MCGGTPITAASSHHTQQHMCVFFFYERFQPPPTFPLASALLTKKTVLWPHDWGVSVELREVGEQGCEVGGTVWPVVRREARVLPLWVQ